MLYKIKTKLPLCLEEKENKGRVKNNSDIRINKIKNNN